MPKSILVSELTHSSLFLLQAKLMVSDKKKYSMNIIIDRLIRYYDSATQQAIKDIESLKTSFKLENIET